MLTKRLDRLGQFGDGIHAGFGDEGLSFSIGLGPVKTRSPFQPGDWVRLHAHPHAYWDPFLRDGFRGYILGGLGPNGLRGTTDDGREWFADWVLLVPDGQPTTFYRCACCEDPRAATERARPVDLLDLLVGAS